MTKSKIKTVIAVIACVLALVLIAGLLCIGLIKKPENPTLSTVPATDGAQLEYGEQNKVQLTARLLEREQYAEYDVSAQAESAYTLTATVLPENATNKALNWSVSFVNPSSAWATGKTATAYIKVTASGNTATVSCLQAFGERIKITATSQADNTKFATCFADYKQRLSNFSVTLGDIVYYPSSGGFYYVNGRLLNECRIMLDFEQSVSAPCKLDINGSSTYTIPSSTTVKYELTPTNELITGAINKSLDGNALLSYSGTLTDNTEKTIENYFDKAWVSAATANKNEPDLQSAIISLIRSFESRTAYTLSFYLGDADEPMHTYNLVFDSSVTIGLPNIQKVSFDKTELEF